MSAANSRQRVFLTRDQKSALVREACERLTLEGLESLTLKQLSERAATISKEKEWGEVKGSTIEGYLKTLSDERKKDLHLWVAAKEGQRPRRKVKLRKEVRQVDYPGLIESLPPEKKTRRGLIEAAEVDAWKVESYLFQHPEIARLLDDG